MSDESVLPEEVSQALQRLMLASNAAAQASIRLASATAALAETVSKIDPGHDNGVAGELDCD